MPAHNDFDDTFPATPTHDTKQGEVNDDRGVMTPREDTKTMDSPQGEPPGMEVDMIVTSPTLEDVPLNKMINFLNKTQADEVESMNEEPTPA